MNEIRDLMIGIDFGKENTQICYYDRKGEEPRSLTMKVGTSQYEAPTVSVGGWSRRITVWVWKRSILQEKKAASS